MPGSLDAASIHIALLTSIEEVLRDARTYWDVLTPSAFMMGDDYNRDWPDIIKVPGHFCGGKLSLS